MEIIDVARKALILARGMGWKLELGDVQVTPLYPTEMGSMTVRVCFKKCFE
jgi:aspartokinase/homoserine dehydrogenase 1